MSCRETQELIHGYIDGELDLVRNLEMERHLRECPACAGLHEKLAALRSTMSGGSLYFPPPPGLERRVRSELRKAADTPHPIHARRIDWRWAGMAAALVLTVMGAWRFAVQYQRPAASELLAQEVVASHVRSLMAAHLTDVPSSDGHTVKPWFNGKLDFSPPVVDFSGSGFPLLGGRLDYVDRRTVAALVYQRQKHLINLLIWPSSGQSDEAMQLMERQGYHLLRWTKSGMNYWVVSDLNAGELGQFAKLVQATP
jgi:anti-sigma factor RsiW